MTTYYEVQRSLTCKAIGDNKRGFSTYDKNTDKFNTIAEVKQFLKDTYGKCKRVKIYRDTKEQEAKHTGYIYCYNTPKYSYDDQPKHNQDWTEVIEIKATTIII